MLGEEVIGAVEARSFLFLDHETPLFFFGGKTSDGDCVFGQLTSMIIIWQSNVPLPPGRSGRST
jgi:hypothetical protein